jgi:hypothetical protein
VVGATGIEPIFGPKSQPADFTKIACNRSSFLRYTFEIVYFYRANHLPV